MLLDLQAAEVSAARLPVIGGRLPQRGCGSIRCVGGGR